VLLARLMLSGVNEKKFTGEIATHPFTPDDSGGWLFPLEGISVNGNVVDLSSNASNSSRPRAIVSTSGNTIYGPEDAIKQIYAHIPGAQLVPYQSNPLNASYQFPCENTLGIDIRFTIGGREYAMRAVDMVLGTVDGSTYGDGHRPGPTPRNGSCVGAFRAIKTDFLWVL
jgi:hypothetical protein